MQAKKTERFSMWIDPETKEKLGELAKRLETSKGELVCDLIRRAAEGEAAP
jgi:hypothetical protein